MRRKIDVREAFAETLDGLDGSGLLLMTGPQGNPMTIGWAMLGRIWKRPVMTVLVRPSRHSFSLLAETPEFTVNVPPPGMKKILGICGTKSGRDTDKLAECGLTAVPSADVSVPYLAECPVHFECRVIHTTEVLNSTLDPAVVEGSYPKGNYHRVYHGLILGTYREG